MASILVSPVEARMRSVMGACLNVLIGERTFYLPKKALDDSIVRVGPELSAEFSGTQVGLKVSPELRKEIQDLKEELLALSAKENYYGHPVCLTQNHCHGAAKYLRRVLKSKLDLEATVLTYNPSKWNDGGYEHSLIVVRNFFGPNSPLVIDPTYKQFMRSDNLDATNDIFVGSPDEYLHFMNKHDVSRALEWPVDTFEKFLRATESPTLNKDGH